MPANLLNFALVLFIASLFGIGVTFLKQPLIISYVLTGLSISFLSYFKLVSLSGFGFLPEVGVAFLLFLIGMELDLREIKRVGRTVVGVGIIHSLILFVWGMALARLFSFTIFESIFLGISVSFSSTVVVVKFLSDKKETVSLHGKIAVGILLIEDILAIFVLFALGLLSKGVALDSVSIVDLLTKISSLFTVYLLAVFVSKDILPKVLPQLSLDGELLFLVSISFCLFFSSLAFVLGIPMGIGAFLAGFALASEPFKFHISARIRPLRDLFVALFFIDMASKVSFGLLASLFLPLVLLIFFLLVIKPYVIYLLLVLFGESKRVSFLSSFSMNQISEFSLIIMATAFSLKMVSNTTFSLAVLLFALSVIFSSILTSRAKEIFKKLENLPIFLEASRVNKTRDRTEVFSNHVILIGCHRVGEIVLRFLKRASLGFVVLDFNPDVTSRLSKEEVPCVFGDMEDAEILEKLNVQEAKMIISTVPSLSGNMSLLTVLKRMGASVPTLVVAGSPNDARELYNNGATYVAMPEALGGEHLVTLLERFLKGDLDQNGMERYQGEEQR